MRHALLAALCLSLGLCVPLPGQAAPLSPAGDWLDESGAVLCLDEDGAFAILSPHEGSAGRFGLSWSREGDSIVFRSMLSPCAPVDQARMKITELTPSMLAVRGEDGREWRWSKAPAGTVRRLEASLMYLERMALPPEVMVSAALSLDSGKVISSELQRKEGGIPMPVRIHYLASRAENAETANLSAAMLTREGALFSTPEAVDVQLDAGTPAPSVRLNRVAANGGEALCPPSEERPSASLTETYWKLTTLAGSPVHVAEGGREAHMVLHEGGKGNGSDGCNGFFMGWESRDGKLSFQPGGGTLMMCGDAAMKQARTFMETLGAVDGWAIDGEELSLLRGGEIVATFRAVAL